MKSEPIKHKILEAISNRNGVRDNHVVLLPKDGLLDYLQSTIRDLKGNIGPFFVLDIRRVVSLVEEWDRSFPSIRPYYAVKCNPDPNLVGVLATLGANFDCASKSEIELVLSLGVSPNRIVFANPCKPKSHILYAKSVGVNLATYDSVYEIEKMHRLHPECALLLRINVPDFGAVFPLGSKFGALPCEVETLLEAAKSARLPVLGISFHVGSGSNNPEAYEAGLALAKAAFDTAELLGFPKFRLLNIGGGFVSGPHFEAAAEAVNLAIKLHFGNDPNLTVIAEPGRYFAEKAMTFAANVIGKRVRGEVREYWIGDGVYGALSIVTFEKEKANPTPFAAVSKPGNVTCEGEGRFLSTVFGPTCAAVDVVATSLRLPELVVDDWLLFEDMGSYTTACGSSFNGFATSEIPIRVVYSDVDVTTLFEGDSRA